jgi:SAM-dependent methyltransferase
MSAWDRGYVSDVAYTMGYYRAQSPAHLDAACLLCGVATDLSARRDDMHYLEIGCGHGFGAIVLAASNPGWHVTGLDFNPTHVASARRLAREARINNVAFIEADLSSFAGSQAAQSLPEADVVSAHGVWSWVRDDVRAGIVRLLAEKLRAGGIAHLSYNSLPGWQGGLGLQRLMREAGRRDGGRSDRQAQVGVRAAQALRAVEARHLASDFARELLDKLETAPIAYAAHEFMNDAWSPCFHADVAAAMAEAKLDWVGSAAMLDNFPALMLTEGQRVIHDQIDDPIMRELIKDMCGPRMLRQDIYARGAARISPQARDAAIEELTLALCVDPDRFAYTVQLPAGEASLARDYYQPIVRALADGPRRIGDLLSLPEHGGKRDNPAELLGMLVGTEQAIVVARPEAGTGDAAARLNASLAGRYGNVANGTWAAALASERLGAGLPAGPLELFAVDRIRRGDDPARSAEDWIAHLAPPVGEADEADLARRDELRKVFAAAPARARVWRAAGVL